MARGMLAARVRGFLDRRRELGFPVKSFLDDRSNALLGFASGALSRGGDWGSAFGGLAQGRALDQARRDAEEEEARIRAEEESSRALFESLLNPGVQAPLQVPASNGLPPGTTGFRRLGPGETTQRYGGAISSIESGGDYGEVGPPADAEGHRAYGKYQVMDYNIGPWTEQVLGRAMTPQEFLASPEAQDAVFDGIFGGYVQQYGPDGAAQAWFGGPGSVGQGGAGADVLGTTGTEYVDRFNEALGGGRPTASAAPPTHGIDPERAQLYEAMLANPQTREMAQGLILQDLLAQPEAGDPYTLGPDQTRFDANNQPIARGIQPRAEADDRERAADQNGVLRFIDNGQPVFPGVEAAPNVQDEGALRDDFDRLTADIRDTVAAYSRIEAAYANPTGPGDIALIFAFMRMLDPASTVREGEFATAQQTTGIPGWIANLYNQAISGVRLNDQQRTEFLEQARMLREAAVARYDQVGEFFRGLATDYNFDPNRIVRPIDAVGAANDPLGWR